MCCWRARLCLCYQNKQDTHTEKKNKPKSRRASVTLAHVEMFEWQNERTRLTQNVFSPKCTTRIRRLPNQGVCFCVFVCNANQARITSAAAEKKRKKLLIYTNLLPIDRSRDAPSSGLAASPPIPPPPGIFLMRPPLPHIRRRWIWRRTGTFFYCNRIFDVCHRARQFRCCR